MATASSPATDADYPIGLLMNPRLLRHEFTVRPADGGTRDTEVAKVIFSFHFLLRKQEVLIIRPPGRCTDNSTGEVSFSPCYVKHSSGHDSSLRMTDWDSSEPIASSRPSGRPCPVSVTRCSIPAVRPIFFSMRGWISFSEKFLNS